MHSLMRESAQNNLSNEGIDAALVGALHGGLNIAAYGAPLSSL